jgi:hypothetical protein
LVIGKNPMFGSFTSGANGGLIDALFTRIMAGIAHRSLTNQQSSCIVIIVAIKTRTKVTDCEIYSFIEVRWTCCAIG